jgi:hypothetical protein
VFLDCSSPQITRLSALQPARLRNIEISQGSTVLRRSSASLLGASPDTFSTSRPDTGPFALRLLPYYCASDLICLSSEADSKIVCTLLLDGRIISGRNALCVLLAIHLTCLLAPLVGSIQLLHPVLHGNFHVPCMQLPHVDDCGEMRWRLSSASGAGTLLFFLLSFSCCQPARVDAIPVLDRWSAAGLVTQ